MATLSHIKRLSEYLTIEVFVGIIILTIILMAVPLFQVHDSYEHPKPSTVALHMVSGSVFVAIPMVLELFLDRKLPRNITWPRLLAIFALSGPGLMMLFGNYYWLIYGGFVREICVRGSLMCNMFQDKRAFTPSRKVNYFIILLSFGVDLNIRIVYTFDALYQTVHSPQKAILFFIYMASIFYFAYVVYHMTSGASAATRGGEKFCCYYSVLLLFSLFAKFILRFLVQKLVLGRMERENQMLIAHNILDILLCVLASIIPSRIARHDHNLAQVWMTIVYDPRFDLCIL